MKLRLGVFEFVRGGGLIDSPIAILPESLLAEGSSMLLALLQDLQSIEEVEVVAPLDPRLNDQVKYHPSGRLLNGSRDWLAEWTSIAQECDQLLVIAPELDGILTHCMKSLRSTGVDLIACDDLFLKSTCNKLETASHWQRSNATSSNGTRILTPETLRASEIESASQLHDLRDRSLYPALGWVWKRIDGAGCQGQHSSRDSTQLISLIQSEPQPENWIVQPWIDGIAASVSVLCGPPTSSGTQRIILPASSQSISFDEQGTNYFGGIIPWRGIDPELLKSWVDCWLEAIPGQPLGWVGIDFIIPYATPDPIAIEINPRLTTSFVGLRQIVKNNLSHGMLQIVNGKRWEPKYSGQTLQFFPDGSTQTVNGT